MRPAGLALVIVAVLTAAAPPVPAAPALRVAGDLSFSRDELATAVGSRISDEHAVEAAASPGGVLVTVDGRSRVAAIGARRGSDAARLVALVAAGLIVDRPDAPLPSPPPPPTPMRLALGARGSIAGGAPGGGVWVGIDRGARWRWTVGVGLDTRSHGVVSLIEIPVRAGLAAAIPGGDVTVTAVALPLVARGGVGDRRVVLGASAAMAFEMLRAERVRWALHLGLDAMAGDVTYAWAGSPIAASGRVRPWLGLSATWESR